MSNYVNNTLTSSNYTYLGKDEAGNAVYRDNDSGQLFNTPSDNQPEPKAKPKGTPPPDWRSFTGDAGAGSIPSWDYPQDDKNGPHFNPVTNKWPALNSAAIVKSTEALSLPLNFRSPQNQGRHGLKEDVSNLFFPDIDILKEQRDCICVRHLTKERFKQYFKIKEDYIFGRLRMKKYKETYRTPIEKFLAEFEKLFESPYEINNCYRKAHFLAQAWKETFNWGSLEEETDGRKYDPDRNSHAIENGNTQIGDGPKYIGRGVMHLTWKDNYKDYGTKVHIDLVKHYEDVAAKLFIAVNSGGWLWHEGNRHHKSLNPAADMNDSVYITKTINGGGASAETIFDRKQMTDYLLRVFNARNCIYI